jgi:hypothetical protein
LRQKLIEAADFNGQFAEKNGYWELKDGAHKSITTTSRYQTWTVNYHLQEDYKPASDVILDEDKAVSLAWAYLGAFGISSDTVRYAPDESRINGDFRLEFSGTEKSDRQMVTGQVTVYLAADGELMSISDNRVWCEYVREVTCIAAADAIKIAQDVGVGDWNGTAYITSVAEDYAFIKSTGYLVPAWKINANFLSAAGTEHAWTPLVDAVK